MGKAELLSKIKLEFEAEANKIAEETESHIRQMEKENTERISAKRHEIFAGLNKNLADVHKKDLIETDIKIRNLLLEVKQNLIDDVFEEAQAEIIKGPDYNLLIKNMLTRSVHGGEGEVVFSKEDSKNFSGDFIKKINSSLNLSPKYGDFRAGFILRYSGIEINNTFETIFGHLRKDLEMEIGKILFS